MYNLPGTRMPCLPILSCSLTTIPSPAPAKSSFASNFVHEYLSKQPQQEIWRVILLLLILPNSKQPGGEGCWSYIPTCLHTKGLQLLVVAELPWEKWTLMSHPLLHSGDDAVKVIYPLKRLQGLQGLSGESWVTGNCSGYTLLAICCWWLSSSLSTLLDIQPCLPERILSLHWLCNEHMQLAEVLWMTVLGLIIYFFRCCCSWLQNKKKCQCCNREFCIQKMCNMWNKREGPYSILKYSTLVHFIDVIPFFWNL